MFFVGDERALERALQRAAARRDPQAFCVRCRADGVFTLGGLCAGCYPAPGPAGAPAHGWQATTSVPGLYLPPFGGVHTSTVAADPANGECAR